MIRWCDNPEMAGYLESIIPGRSVNEIRELFQEKYGITLTNPQIKSFKSWRHLKSGTVGGRFEKGHVCHNKGKKMSPEVYEKAKATMFKKGNVPVNHKPVGTEEYRPGTGYVFVKVAEPNKWRLKQRVLWEEYYNEKLTNNDVIVFIDNNTRNFEIDNLCKLTRSELVRLNQDHYRCEDPEINKAAINIAKIRAKMGNKEKPYD